MNIQGEAPSDRFFFYLFQGFSAGGVHACWGRRPNRKSDPFFFFNLKVVLLGAEFMFRRTRALTAIPDQFCDSKVFLLHVRKRRPNRNS